MSRNIDLMLEAASQEEENREAFAILRKASVELRAAIDALNSAKKELNSTKEELQNARKDLHDTYHKLINAKKALDAAACSTGNIVDGITNAIVKAEQSTVPVGVKASDMASIGVKLTEYLGKVSRITVDATNSQIREFQKQRRNAYNQYKEWDGIWFGRYAQWFFLGFYFFGFGAVVLLIVQTFVNN